MFFVRPFSIAIIYLYALKTSPPLLLVCSFLYYKTPLWLSHKTGIYFRASTLRKVKATFGQGYLKYGVSVMSMMLVETDAIAITSMTHPRSSAMICNCFMS